MNTFRVPVVVEEEVGRTCPNCGSRLHKAVPTPERVLHSLEDDGILPNAYLVYFNDHPSLFRGRDAKEFVVESVQAYYRGDFDYCLQCGPLPDLGRDMDCHG